MKTFEAHKQILHQIQPVGVTGSVSAVRGLTVSVADFPAPIGASCRIVRGRQGIDARVIGFAGEETLIMPLGTTTGICRRDRVEFTSAAETVSLCPDMLGRVLDGFARPIDGAGDIQPVVRMPIWPEPMPTSRRRRITEPLTTGIRAIDSAFSVGRGQRMSILSGSGVGKSVLLGMIGRHTVADVTVVALIGERGAEARDFIDRKMSSDQLRRAVVVISTGAEPSLVRVQACAVATAIAEYFRDAGADVLLLVDSLTRLATAQRQIGLAAGEPPATRGFTPSVFSLLPGLLERCGRTDAGSITGFYTVLVDGDDMADPIADAVRAVTDGHIWLSRDLANRGHWPAIDMLQSVSRVMADVVDDEHLAAAREMQRLVAIYNDIEELVNLGAYQRGSSVEYDLVIAAIPMIRAFLAQRTDECISAEQTRTELLALHKRIVETRREISSRRAVGAIDAGGVGR